MIIINYKAHIPAGVAFAGILSLIAGWPAVVPVLIGGAVGGALPDIDIEGSAIEKMGDKTAGAVSNVAGVFGRKAKKATGILGVIGRGIDLMILSPIAKLWRWLAEHVFGKFYLWLYHLGGGAGKRSLGEVLHWNGDSKPWKHRGGITHSFSFMITSCVFTIPIAFIFQSPEFLIGCEAGIVSHLVADSFCKSGVKFFFPFQPKIGFDNDKGAGRGRDIRLLPKGLQVSTGKDRITNRELESYPDQELAMQDRKLRRREKMWQWIFKLLALALVIILLFGVIGPGGITWSIPTSQAATTNETVATGTVDNGNSSTGNDGNGTSSGIYANSSDTTTTSDNTNNNNNSSTTNNSATTFTTSSSDGTSNSSSSVGDIATEGSTLSGVNPITLSDSSSYNTKAEIAGPTSLTLGDLDVSELPRGIMKMPDESLWIIGVGPVTKDNLENPKWVFTDDEKKKLLAAATAQRLDDIPTSVSNIFTDATNTVTDAVNSVTNGSSSSSSSNTNSNTNSESTGNTFADLFKSITGIDIGQSGYSGGFLGITKWTDS